MHAVVVNSNSEGQHAELIAGKEEDLSCDRICEKGPHPAKFTFAVRSFVVGHVDLGRSPDFFMNS